MRDLLEDVKRSKYMSFIPDFLKENEDFLVFLALLFHEFDIAEKNIYRFTDLVNPDKVPIEFIEALGSYFNFTYLANATDDFNREALMRMRSIWEQRGTEHSIIMAGTHGGNDGYVGGDLFIPGYDISKELAELTIARDLVFRHNISKHSGTAVFESDIYRTGVLFLRVPYLDEDVKNIIYNVTPAGLRYVFEIMLDFFPSPGQDVGEFNELSFKKAFRVWPIDELERAKEDTDIDVILEICMKVLDDSVLTSPYALIHSKKNSGRMFSGRVGASYNSWMFDREVESIQGVSMLPMSMLKRQFTKNSSDSSAYIKLSSGEYVDTVSKGYANHIFGRNLDWLTTDVEIVKVSLDEGVYDIPLDGERDILPQDPLYDWRLVENERPGDLRDPCYMGDVEITFSRM